MYDQDYIDTLVVEERYLRAHRFWEMRDNPIAWPIEPRGYTFLGHGVHLLGAALFPDWKGKEPAQFHLLALESGNFHEASENKRRFAKAILLKFDAAADHNVGRAEMSIAEWDRAIELYAMNEWPNIAAARRKMAALMRTIIEAAAHQKLFMATRTNFGLPIASPPSEWTTEWAYPRFAECQMNPDAPFANMPPLSLFGAPLPSVIDLIPGNQWIFVETESLKAFLSEISAGRDAVSDTQGSDGDQPQRLPATIKEDIKTLLRDIIRKWREGGGALELQVGKTQFTKFATNRIADAKPRWATDIWLENRPDEWAKRGPRK